MANYFEKKHSALVKEAEDKIAQIAKDYGKCLSEPKDNWQYYTIQLPGQFFIRGQRRIKEVVRKQYYNGQPTLSLTAEDGECFGLNLNDLTTSEIIWLADMLCERYEQMD